MNSSQHKSVYSQFSPRSTAFRSAFAGAGLLAAMAAAPLASAAVITYNGAVFGVSGANNDEAEQYRSTSVVKTRDLTPGGDGIYGTDGRIVYGHSDTTANDGQFPFPSPDPLTYSDAGRGYSSTVVTPSYVSSFNTLNSARVGAGSGTYLTLDNPNAAAAGVVGDRKAGIAFLGSLTPGQEVTLLSFTIGANAPSTFRVGVLVDFTGAGDSPAALRWTQTTGGIASGSALNLVSDGAGDIHFFDFANVQQGDVFQLTLTERIGGSASNIAVGYTGLVFDSVPEPSASLLALLPLAFLAWRRKVRR